jgi:hypothetical protein
MGLARPAAALDGLRPHVGDHVDRRADRQPIGRLVTPEMIGASSRERGRDAEWRGHEGVDRNPWQAHEYAPFLDLIVVASE